MGFQEVGSAEGGTGHAHATKAAHSWGTRDWEITFLAEVWQRKLSKPTCTAARSERPSSVRVSTSWEEELVGWQR